MSLPIALDYGVWLADLKARIAGARARAVLAANAEQIALYHELGREILARQGREGWGAKVIDRLSADLRAAFPDMKGLSTRNLMYMRDFARAYPDPAIVQRLAAPLPWFHIVTLHRPPTRARHSSACRDSPTNRNPLPAKLGAIHPDGVQAMTVVEPTRSSLSRLWRPCPQQTLKTLLINCLRMPTSLHGPFINDFKRFA